MPSSSANIFARDESIRALAGTLPWHRCSGDKRRRVYQFHLAQSPDAFDLLQFSQ
jgi:hypothetical protein